MCRWESNNKINLEEIGCLKIQNGLHWTGMGPVIKQIWLVTNTCGLYVGESGTLTLEFLMVYLAVALS
jgi:hypothetical protein